MSKSPVYGFEKPYFENIKKELSVYVNEVYYDDFQNLVFVKNSNDKSAKTILVGAYASENAFLVNEIKDNGEICCASLFNTDDTIINNKAECKNKAGYIKKDGDGIILDFGCSDKKSAEKIAKCGDTLYIKAVEESLGNYFFTNEKAHSLKNIISNLIKKEYSNNMIFVLFREKQKGAYALGKNIKADESFFITFCDDLKDEISYLKKEKNYISEFETDKIPCHICENNISYADSYYLSGGSKYACGIGIKSETMKNGITKFSKNSVNELAKFLGSL